MFCSKCGNKLNDNDNFCNKCGERVNKSVEREFKKTTFNKTFKSGLMIRKVQKMLDEANSFLMDKNLISVYANYTISDGLVYTFTLECTEIDKESKYLFQMAHIKLGVLGTRTPDKYIEEWRAKNRDKVIVNQRIINYNGLSLEVWIIYKVNR